MTIASLLNTAVKRKASDVHLAEGYPPIFRLNGSLVNLKAKLLTPKTIETVAKEMANAEQWQHFQDYNELDFAYQHGKHRFRVNLQMQRGSIAISARYIPAIIPTFEEIRLPPIIEIMMGKENGLILVTGPAGTGKSTTLAAMIGHINKNQSKTIITLEDPIEFVFPHKKSLIRQREVGVDTFTFQEGLRHVLRQDPDVLMVGEMRDLDTVATTVTLAETGHLVFSTLHTRTAAATVTRVIDSFPGSQQNQIRFQMAMSLRGVISQILLPAIDGKLVAAREILVNNTSVSSLIRQGKVEQITNVIQTGRTDGMVTMEQDIRRLQKEKVISKEVADDTIYTLGT